MLKSLCNVQWSRERRWIVDGRAGSTSLDPDVIRPSLLRSKSWTNFGVSRWKAPMFEWRPTRFAQRSVVRPGGLQFKFSVFHLSAKINPEQFLQSASAVRTNGSSECTPRTGEIQGDICKFRMRSQGYYELFGSLTVGDSQMKLHQLRPRLQQSCAPLSKANLNLDSLRYKR